MSTLATTKNHDPVADGGREQPVILVVEDDEPMRQMIAAVLESLDAIVLLSKDVRQAMEIIETREVAVVLTDLRMPHADGIDILKFSRMRNPLTQVVLITGHATVESAVMALKNGAFDYLRKPFEPADLRREIGNALEYFLLNRENVGLRDFSPSMGNDDLVGNSPSIGTVNRLIDIAAPYDSCVLITGESGTGKEIVSRRIHALSERRTGPFIAVNCSAIPENLIESELFGYQRGAFTGAEHAKIGLFEAADGGTLFFDEINNTSLSFQAKLLRVLQDGMFFRVGETKPRYVNVRLLAASNKPLKDLVANGSFRMDLYYRLKLIEIDIPPLRERLGDIPLLVNYFIARHSVRMKKPVKGITTKALNLLVHHDWPGNGRELENVVQRMIIFTTTDLLDVDVVPPELADVKEPRLRAIDEIWPQSLEEVEMTVIARTLQKNNGNRAVTAEILGIDKSTLWRKIKQYKIE
ncbi:MAG: sigma-54 dependent transcriptional regulator [Sterolibacterium sp.]